MRFIDLFAGCGGLSLGLSWSGAQGLFAIERDSMAFETFRTNFLDNPQGFVRRFEWPAWLEQRAWGIDDMLARHSGELEALGTGAIDLIAGGPPCQGFSFAGRRNADDPRNLLFKRYLEVVRIIRPTAVLLENVPGMAVAHRVTELDEPRIRHDISGSYFETLVRELGVLGYDVEGRIIDASRFGVPQKRARLIVVGILRKRCDMTHSGNYASLVFDKLEAQRDQFLKGLGLVAPVSAQNAIGDLTLLRRDGCGFWPLQTCEDPISPTGFFELAYDGRRSKTAYQRLMRSGAPVTDMDSMRLARHSDEVRDRFRQIILTCRQGVRMNDGDRASFKLKKHRIYPMSADDPAPTVTTLPDDILHYCDPRILTVREYARLQSFPDWFKFKGKYTTGGDRRTRECPRYTQAGNAVPPLLGLAIGKALHVVLDSMAASNMQHARQTALAEEALAA
jgi:DNA (cytosine-5)-methyltransferase 1